MNQESPKTSPGTLILYGFIGLLWVAAGAAIYVTFFAQPPVSTATEPKPTAAQTAKPADDEPDGDDPTVEELQATAVTLDENGKPIDPNAPTEPFELPDFEFINQSKATVSKETLAGKPWVVTFVFSNCPGPCAQITGKMRQLQKDLNDYDINLVSLTVDPKRDTPERLTKYADAYTNDLSNWHFLTGSQQNIYTLIQKGFRMPVGEVAEGNIIHVNKFVVVDAKGFVIDSFDAHDSDAEFLKLKKAVREIASKKSESDAATAPEATTPAP